MSTWASSGSAVAGQGGAPEPGLDGSRQHLVLLRATRLPARAGGSGGDPLAQNSVLPLAGWGQGPQSLPMRSTAGQRPCGAWIPGRQSHDPAHGGGPSGALYYSQGLLLSLGYRAGETLPANTGHVLSIRAPGSRETNGEGRKPPEVLVAPEYGPSLEAWRQPSPPPTAVAGDAPILSLPGPQSHMQADPEWWPCWLLLG